MTMIAPSLLAADFGNLRAEVARIEQGGCDWLHLDVMDGHFVPNITFGPPLVSSLRPHSALIFDVHLMIDDPLAYVEPFRRAGADYITFHYEAADEPAAVIAAIKAVGAKAGISVKPGTAVAVLEPLLQDLDLVLVMSVEPGFGGQKFMPDMLTKVEWLYAQRAKNGHRYLIQIDGGVSRANAEACVAAGCDVLVAGTAVMGAKDPVAEIAYYHTLGRNDQ